MNRIFHARLSIVHCLFLLLVTLLALFGLWQRNILMAFLPLLLMLLCVERIIHTTYVINFKDQTLRFCYGRFSRERVIPLVDIISVEQGSLMRVAGISLGHCLILHYKVSKADAQSRKEHCVTLFPVSEEEFVKQIKNRDASRTPVSMS